MDIIDDIIKLALLEDLGCQDITTQSIVSDKAFGKAKIIAKESFVLAGTNTAKKVFRYLDPDSKISLSFIDGDFVKKDDIILEIKGNLSSLLKAERLALNFLQRLSGVATLTNLYVKKLEKKKVFFTDTRKTTPGLRYLEKEAVRAGGGNNHRMGLFDGILIKDNHIAAAGSIVSAIKKAKQKALHLMNIEIEVSSLDGVKEALKAGADIIMLDNMDYSQMAKAVKLIKGRAITEASGNVSLKNINKIADTGVDIISCGAIIHQARFVDISMRIV